MPASLTASLHSLLEAIYPQKDNDKFAKDITNAFWTDESEALEIPKRVSFPLWSEKDSVVITYGDSIIDEATPLKTLHHFLRTHLKETINSVHILPFFPYSSDDGFAVMDYYAVNEKLGSWDDISDIAGDFRLMADLVINHASAQGIWFKKFIECKEPEKDFFYTADPKADLSQVVRPRSNPLLTPTETKEGIKHVWCTFGADQVDLNFANPEVLLEFIRIMRFYIEKGVRIFRLDAVAFLWKELDTACINRPQTHAIIKLLRVLASHHAEDIILITETNIPNHENLSYFGHQDEAHLIYNFSLPPLMVHALLNGTSLYLRRWLMSMPPSPEGCAYLNFTASHDGIGLRPAEGLLPEEEIAQMIDTIKSFGGKVSMRTGPGGIDRPYEMNIALFDAMKGTTEGQDDRQIERFLASQTIMMALEGVPAFYIHSLLATSNDYEKFKTTLQNRSLNRHRWNSAALNTLLADETTHHAKILKALKERLKIRLEQPAFHPNATQFTLDFGDTFFGFWRQSQDRTQSIFCITNMTHTKQSLDTSKINMTSINEWCDLLTDKPVRVGSILNFAPYQTVWISNNP
jgi:sucrose phosphorylase